MKKHLITSLDIGSFTTNVVVLEHVDGRYRIAARASTPTRGIEAGYISSPADVQETMAKVLLSVENQIGEKIREIILSASGTGLESDSINASTIITLGSGEVTDLDVKKSILKAEKKASTPNKRIIESIPLSYTLDGESVTGTPNGMKGKKLETTVFFITFPTTTVETFEEICDTLDIDILDIIPGPLASSCVSLSDIERKVGSILVDIGADSTSLLVYEHDTPLLLKVLDYGSREMTNAIALGLKVSVEEAEKIKLGGPVLNQTHFKKVDTIITKQLNALFKQINKELGAINKKELLPAGIILSGGGALIRDVEEVAKSILAIPARKGSPRNVKKDVDDKDVPWSVAYGLAVLGLERQQNGAYGSFGGFSETMKGFLKRFFI